MIRLLFLAALTLGAPGLASGTWVNPPQQTEAAPPKSPFAGLIAEYLRRDANGHSPSPDEISAMASLRPLPDPASITEAMPYLLKALANPDIPLHTFALTAIVGLQSSASESSPDAPSPEAGSVAFKPDTAKALTPYIPQIAAHLTSEEQHANRLLTATILGGFTPNPPASVYTPLLAYLTRDDAIGEVGLAVVSDLVQIAPINDTTAATITRYLRRSDQTSDSRANLADLIATKPNQSQAINKSLLVYLNSDDNSLRARVILSLPQMDLASDDFAETKSRIDRIAGDPNENLQVITAARSIATCWTATKLATGCPTY